MCACVWLITMLSVGCFQCPLFGRPDRTLLRGRAREGKRPLNNVLIVSFHHTASSVQATGTAVWSTAPKEQLGSTLRLCVVAEAFSPHLAVVTKPAYIFLAIRRFPALSRHERVISGQNTKANVEKSFKFLSHVSGCTLETFRCFRQLGFAMIMSWITGVCKYQEELNAPFCAGAWSFLRRFQ